MDIGICKKCNSNCIMCTNIMPIKNNIKEISLDKLKEIIDQNPSNEFTITGGEPTIRKDMFQFLKYINQKYPKSKISLITNGRIFSYKNIAKKIKQISNIRIKTEIHGDTPELHDLITKTPGSFNQTIQGIKNLLDLDLDIEFRIVVSKLNYKQILKIAKFITNQFKKIEKYVIFPIDYIGNAYINKKNLIVKYSEISTELEKTIEYLEQNDKNVALYHVPYCTISNKYWKNICKLETVENKRLFTPQICEYCKFVKTCPKIWKTYSKIIGNEELKPITYNKINLNYTHLIT